MDFTFSMITSDRVLFYCMAMCYSFTLNRLLIFALLSRQPVYLTCGRLERLVLQLTKSTTCSLSCPCWGPAQIGVLVRDSLLFPNTLDQDCPRHMAEKLLRTMSNPKHSLGWKWFSLSLKSSYSDKAFNLDETCPFFIWTWIMNSALSFSQKDKMDKSMILIRDTQTNSRKPMS